MGSTPQKRSREKQYRQKKMLKNGEHSPKGKQREAMETGKKKWGAPPKREAIQAKNAVKKRGALPKRAAMQAGKAVIKW